VGARRRNPLRIDKLSLSLYTYGGDSELPASRVETALCEGRSDGLPPGGFVMPVKNPPHPGRIVRQDCVEPLGLTVTGAAKVLGVTRQALNNLVNGKAGISPEMAVRISKAFGGSPEMWLRLQANYDLARVQQDEIEVKRYRRAS
jgi:addiction module HigA family antidote